MLAFTLIPGHLGMSDKHTEPGVTEMAEQKTETGKKVDPLKVDKNQIGPSTTNRPTHELEGKRESVYYREMICPYCTSHVWLWYDTSAWHYYRCAVCGNTFTA
jgi:DNA-directed RNA polymerase subunit RPC12/RpoP